MAQNNNINITGRNIYSDNHGQTVFYDYLTKTGYIIDEKDKNKFYLYKNRFILVIIAMILGSSYFPNVVYVILTGAAICIIAELLFRVSFLRSLRVAKKFNRDSSKTMLEATIASKEPKKALMRAILYCAFAILIVVNAIMIEADLPIMIVSVLLSVISAYCAIINIIALIKMK